MSKITCLVTLLLVAQATFYKINPQTDPEAVCLDGSPSAFYVSNGTETRKLLLFFFGTASCGDKSGTANTLKACYDRSKTFTGSSTNWPVNWTDSLVGIMSSDPSKNPTFANWTKFFFIYCDGMLHQGYRQEPVPYNGSKLYFRGDRITKGHFKWIDMNYGLYNDATDVVVTGEGMGAITTYLWTNYLQKLVKGGTVHTILDSGIYVNQPNYLTKTYDYQQIVKSIVKIVNVQIGTPFEECNAVYRDNLHQCLMFQYAYPFIKGRVMVFNSMYDTAALKSFIGINCIKVNDFAGCPTTEMRAVEQYHSSYLNVLNQYLNSPNASAWSIACANNGYLGSEFYFTDNTEAVPAGSGRTASVALGQWMSGTTVRMVDIVNWPNNAPCAHKNKLSIATEDM